MYREMKIRKLTDIQKDHVKKLGIDYGFEVYGSGARGYTGFLLERDGKNTYARIEYKEYNNRNEAEVEIDCALEPSSINKKTLTRTNELSDGIKALIDAFEKANQSSRARISGDGVWRSRIS